MNDPARKAPTYDDVLAAPDHMVAELVDGELHLQPRPASPHARAMTKLTSRLDSEFDGEGGEGGRPGCWWILVEPELHLADEPGRGLQVTVPDLAGWRRERLPALPDAAFFTLPPDWVCEVISPRTARLDRGKKMPHYARAGVGHAWIVDPVNRTLEVYRREGAGWLPAGVSGGDDKVRAEPFDAIEIDLSPLWLEARGEPTQG